MASWTQHRLFHSILTFDDRSKKASCLNVKCQRAFQFLQLLLVHRVYGIDVRTFSSTRRSSKQQQQQNSFDIFLGGSCNPTIWRHEQAIPYCRSHSISYYNPQVDNWTPDLVEIEHRAKELASLLFFVIDHDTRSLAAISEVCYLAARGRDIIVVVSSMPKHGYQTKFMQQKTPSNNEDDQHDYENVCEARRTLRVLLQCLHVPVFDNIRIALENAMFILEMKKRMKTARSEVDREKKDDYTERVLKSPDDVYGQTSQPDMIAPSSNLSHRRYSGTSMTHNVRLSPSSSLFLHSKLALNSSRIYRQQISYSTNESDDDGYGSLLLSNSTVSGSSSSVCSDFCESSSDHQDETSRTGFVINKTILSIVRSFIPLISSLTQSNLFLSNLSRLPFRCIKNTLLPSVTSSTPIENSLDSDHSIRAVSSYMFDLYIAAGDHDTYWLNTIVLPLLEASHVHYTKRQSYRDDDQLDILCDLNICHRSRLLYYLINGHERLSDLTTELAFFIGERKHNIIVYLDPTIDEDSESILTKQERQDIARSRKYLEDLAQKEQILLSHSRDQSWHHVLAFCLRD